MNGTESNNSVAFLDHLRKWHPGPLKALWDDASQPRGERLREYLWIPALGLGLANLPGYSPYFSADEAVWGWAK